MVKFTERIDDAGYVSQCGNCGYPVAVTTYEIRPGEDILLCEVCYSTHLGAASIYGDCACDLPKMFKAMGWIANKILAEIRTGQSVESEKATPAELRLRAMNLNRLGTLRAAREDITKIVYKGEVGADGYLVRSLASYVSAVLKIMDSNES